ncbi:hypothetical protein [Succinimonas sp.]|uniref:hypothetical protein n=1 Tax=Succinimonas sp. TaxID=1936151 RepID=UPI00386A425E
MKGKVKFYKESDGYGFIQGDDGQEYYFNMHDLKVFDGVPRTGHMAEFTPVPVAGKGRKPKATDITVSVPPRNQASGLPEPMTGFPVRTVRERSFPE